MNFNVEAVKKHSWHPLWTVSIQGDRTMARYKAQDTNSLLLPVVFSEQIVPGSFAFALNRLVGASDGVGA